MPPKTIGELTITPAACQTGAVGGAVAGGVIGFITGGPSGVLPGAKIVSDAEDKIIEATTGKKPDFWYENMGTAKKTSETKK
jgi:hypothetical protein